MRRGRRSGVGGAGDDARGAFRSALGAEALVRVREPLAAVAGGRDVLLVDRAAAVGAEGPVGLQTVAAAGTVAQLVGDVTRHDVAHGRSSFSRPFHNKKAACIRDASFSYLSAHHCEDGFRTLSPLRVIGCGQGLGPIP